MFQSLLCGALAAFAYAEGQHSHMMAEVEDDVISMIQAESSVRKVTRHDEVETEFIGDHAMEAGPHTYRTVHEGQPVVTTTTWTWWPFTSWGSGYAGPPSIFCVTVVAITMLSIRGFLTILQFWRNARNEDEEPSQIMTALEKTYSAMDVAPMAGVAFLFIKFLHEYQLERDAGHFEAHDAMYVATWAIVLNVIVNFLFGCTEAVSEGNENVIRNIIHGIKMFAIAIVCGAVADMHSSNEYSATVNCGTTLILTYFGFSIGQFIVQLMRQANGIDENMKQTSDETIVKIENWFEEGHSALCIAPASVLLFMMVKLHVMDVSSDLDNPEFDPASAIYLITWTILFCAFFSLDIKNIFSSDWRFLARTVAAALIYLPAVYIVHNTFMNPLFLTNNVDADVVIICMSYLFIELFVPSIIVSILNSLVAQGFGEVGTTYFPGVTKTGIYNTNLVGRGVVVLAPMMGNLFMACRFRAREMDNDGRLSDWANLVMFYATVFTLLQVVWIFFATLYKMDYANSSMVKWGAKFMKEKADSAATEQCTESAAAKTLTSLFMIVSTICVLSAVFCLITDFGVNVPNGPGLLVKHHTSLFEAWDRGEHFGHDLGHIGHGVGNAVGGVLGGV